MTKPIVVGVDIRDLRIATSGTRTYLEELCRIFRSMDGKEFRFIFFDTGIPVYTGRNRVLKLAEHIRFQLWKQLILPFKAIGNSCDILFCTDFFVPLIQIRYKTVPVFHDAFFFEYPEHYNRLWLMLFRKLAVPAAKRSPAVIIPSYYARDKVQRYTGIAPDRLHVVYEAPKSMQANLMADDTLVRQVKQGREQGLLYLLHIGSFDKRKNLPVLVQAFRKLIQNGYSQFRLVLVGESSAKQHTNATSDVLHAIETNGMEDFVIRTGYLPDGTLPFIYANAFMYVFPSVNEGFGLPVVEAFLFDVPVIVANNTCLPEIGGDAVLGFDPYQPDELYERMKSIIDNPSLREEMIRKGRERLALFSWEKAARELTAIFKNAAAN